MLFHICNMVPINMNRVLLRHLPPTVLPSAVMPQYATCSMQQSMSCSIWQISTCFCHCTSAQCCACMACDRLQRMGVYMPAIPRCVALLVPLSKKSNSVLTSERAAVGTLLLFSPFHFTACLHGLNNN